MDRNNDTKNIAVLGVREGIRKRPEMFIGSVSYEGLHNMVWELIDNSVNEALAGFCSNINVRLLKGGIIEVSDNGRGITVEKHETKKESILEIILTGKYFRGELTDGIYKLSPKKYRGGLLSVNVLSETLEISVIRDSKVWYQKYKKGIPEDNVKQTETAPAEVHGTVIKFLADREIFETLEYNYEIFQKELKKIKGIEIHLSDERNIKEIKTDYFYFKGEIKEFLK
ncbi:ATP-binding protein [Sebaldella sp. S0638]|uniref:ATP-binding protein n=1 Tax=Sebaldella sp. S0638 TaxID=2957809 RepID=UPI00209F416F|nr:ATP-binding protein [Sebaldella sp. S0638]MCP1224361.1 ATP-binding protein [Sebaldella sp. S0638]